MIQLNSLLLNPRRQPEEVREKDLEMQKGYLIEVGNAVIAARDVAVPC
ncbi:MAG: hypothetical protein AB7U95_39490 [Reyranella sp.]